MKGQWIFLLLISMSCSAMDNQKAETTENKLLRKRKPLLFIDIELIKKQNPVITYDFYGNRCDATAKFRGKIDTKEPRVPPNSPENVNYSQRLEDERKEKQMDMLQEAIDSDFNQKVVVISATTFLIILIVSSSNYLYETFFK